MRRADLQLQVIQSLVVSPTVISQDKRPIIKQVNPIEQEFIQGKNTKSTVLPPTENGRSNQDLAYVGQQVESDRNMGKESFALSKGSDNQYMLQLQASAAKIRLPVSAELHLISECDSKQEMSMPMNENFRAPGTGCYKPSYFSSNEIPSLEGNRRTSIHSQLYDREKPKKENSANSIPGPRNQKEIPLITEFKSEFRNNDNFTIDFGLHAESLSDPTRIGGTRIDKSNPSEST